MELSKAKTSQRFRESLLIVYLIVAKMHWVLTVCQTPTEEFICVILLFQE